MLRRNTKLDIYTEDGVRSEKLHAIYEHVVEIASKINQMDDPLPDQLEHSIPNYHQTLKANADRLTNSKCSIVVAGNSSSDKSYVINTLLEEDLMPCFVDAETIVLCEISYDAENWSEIHFWDSAAEPIILKSSANDGFSEELAGFIQATENEVNINWPYKYAKIHTHSKVIQDGITIVDIPVLTYNDDMKAMIADKIYDCSSLIYVLECRSDDNVSTEKLQELMEILSSMSPSSKNKKFLPISSVLFVFCCPDQSSFGVYVRESAIKKLKEFWPNCKDDQIFFLCTAESLSPSQKEFSSDEYCKLLHCIEQHCYSYLDRRITLCYCYIQNFVARALHHLRAFLNQSEKSQEDRLSTYTEIHQRLVQLTFQADVFFQGLKTEVNSKVKEATLLLADYLSSEEVVEQLSCWSDDEIPDGAIWHEVDVSIREKISQKLYIELHHWEDENNFFKSLRPYLMYHFQKQFSGIEKQLTIVENMISRHDSRLCLMNICEADEDKLENDYSSGIFPYNLNLNLGQKIALGVAAPLLVPIALTIAVLGLPILGGIAAKDLINEKIAENKLKEFNVDRKKFLKKRIPDEINKFIHSKNLEKYIKTQLKPAFRCIEQLEEVVPGQIDADKCQVESLKNDAREAKDIVRFYQPLVEILELDKKMLTTFRVMHTNREKLDIKFSQITKPQTVRNICQGLFSEIQGDFWINDDSCYIKSKQAVTLRRINQKLDAKMIEDYLQEEEAYRWQACPHIVKFYGITKDLGYIYHVFESLSCSLKHFLMNSSEAGPEVSHKSRFQFFKTKIIEVVKGLDYLHDRGWVHYDLSLTSVAVGADAKVKLTNISSRKMVKIDRNISKKDIQNYRHLPHEVLMQPPAAYTSVSEMYSVGIMMWEMWTLKNAYEEIICNREDLNTLDDFILYIDSNRPTLTMFHNSEGEPLSTYSSKWISYMQKCWTDIERITSKAWLQLVDDVKYTEIMGIHEQYYTSI